jgi:MOSC domain-containing protein YiiM
MQVLSVNIGTIREVTWKGKIFKTAMFKHPATGPVRAGTLGLAGDQQGNMTNHGGTLKAVFAYPFEHYTEFWRLALPDTPLEFGENLTTEGWMDDQVYIGDVYRVGRALMRISVPRTPCSKLNALLGRDDVLAKYLQSKRTGFYIAVLEPGDVAAGDDIELVVRHPLRITPADIVNLYLGHSGDPELWERATKLDVLNDRMRKILNERFEHFMRQGDEESAEF